MKIFGFGHEDCGDDAAGLLAARRFRDAGFDARELPRSPTRLLDEWSPDDEVVLIDACQSGEPCGSIRCWDVTSGPLPLIRTTPSAHAFGLGETLELARALGRLPRKVWLVTIEGADFTPGHPPSPEVLAAVSRLELPCPTP